MNMDLLYTGITGGCSGAISINCIYAVNRTLIAARLLEPDKLTRSRNRILVESLCFALLFIFILFLTPDFHQAFYRMVLFTIFYGVAVSDALYRIIPNEFVTLIALTGAAMLLTGHSPVSATEALLGGAAGGQLFIYPFFKGRSCGGGDVKLCAAAGLAVGLTALLAALVAMGFILLLYTIFKLVKDKELILSKFLPLGPVLAACLTMQVILLDLFPGYGRLLS
ncbi:MAG: prepilin peptidase [Anaerovoracaceae bacterium]|jgi:Flp pilus assembly protein protease CpaA